MAAANTRACPLQYPGVTPEVPEKYRQIFSAHIQSVAMEGVIYEIPGMTNGYTLTLKDPTTVLGTPFEGDTLRITPGVGYPIPHAGTTAIFFVDKTGCVIPSYDKPDEVQRKSFIETMIDAIKRH